MIVKLSVKSSVVRPWLRFRRNALWQVYRNFFMLGFLLIDKPKGITSFRIVQILRRVLGIKRIGYAGTLDPLATGLMIVAIGEATKFLPWLEKKSKNYQVKIRLGAVSTTYDADGEISNFDGAKGQPDLSEIKKVIAENFLGERWQMPPDFSAIKIGGKRAYALARKGLEVNLKKRKVNFFEIKVLDYAAGVLDLDVHCSSGTYIRSLAHDLGQILHVGGYVEELKRTKIDKYELINAVPLDLITAENISQYLITPQQFLSDWLHVDLNQEEYDLLKQGKYIQKFFVIPLEKPMLAILDGACMGILNEVQPFQFVPGQRISAGSTLLKFARKFTII